MSIAIMLCCSACLCSIEMIVCVFFSENIFTIFLHNTISHKLILIPHLHEFQRNTGMTVMDGMAVNAVFRDRP